jgi:predicted  nucleic acid-binding Zn-ribbon protein
MKHFCTKCGKPTIYALALPKFCSQCGSDFSLVTKEKDKSPHDQALEKMKEKYAPDHQINTQPLIPTTKPEPKLYPNPARASFKIIQDEEPTEILDQEEYDDEIDDMPEVRVKASLFKKIKPKFKIQQYNPPSESFENLLTQSYASNYKPSDSQQLRSEMGGLPQRTPNSILEEFRREAGSSRGQQE